MNTATKRQNRYSYIHVDPFTDTFCLEEMRWMGYDPSRVNAYEVIDTCGDWELISRPIIGRCDDYMTKKMRFGEVPAYTLYKSAGDHQGVWMSLTPMEIQSCWFPAFMAHGHVATAGLGMGYFALRAAANPDVVSIDIYERDSDVIEMFLRRYAHRPEAKKMCIVHGDVREELIHREYDYVWMDTYQTMLPDTVIADIEYFGDNNMIGEYRFWGQEWVMFHAFAKDLFGIKCLADEQREWFMRYMESENVETYCSPGADEGSAIEFAEEVIDALTVGDFL